MAGQTKLMLPSGGSVSISASDSTQNTTVTLPGGDVTLATTSQVMGRNRIINGGMVIDQRNAGASVTPTAAQYTVDRWLAAMTQSSKYSVQQNAGSVTPPSGFTNYLGVTSTSSYSITSTDYFWIGQLVEGFNMADLAWGTASAQSITISFWVRSSLTGTFAGGLRNANANRSYGFNYTISSANTWEFKTVTIAGETSGTWNTTNSVGIRLEFSLGVGSTYTQAAGSWSSGNYDVASGGQSIVGTNGATFYITGVQLEKATTATPFEFRPYGQELALCMRYFETLNMTQGREFLIMQCGSTSVANGSVIFRVPKRASPTSQILSGTMNVVTANGGGAGGSLSFPSSNIDSAGLYITGASGLVAGNATWVYSSGSTGLLGFSAEL